MSTQFFKVKEGAIAYEEYGNNSIQQTIVCIPGMGDTRHEYRFVIASLVEKGYRIIAVDPRGIGESSTSWNLYDQTNMANDIISLITELNLKDVVILGTSLGAGLAVCIAHDIPDRIKKLILLGAFVRDVKPIDWSTNLMYSVLFADMWGAKAWGTYFDTLFPTRKPGDHLDYKNNLMRNLSEPKRLHALRSMMLASKQHSADLLHNINVPTLVVMGDKDPDFKNPQDEAKFIATELNGEYKMIPGAGHYPQVEFPAETIQYIMEFLSRSYGSQK